MLSDWILVRIAPSGGRSRPYDRDGRGRSGEDAEQIALSILLAGLTIIFLLATVTLLARDLQRERGGAGARHGYGGGTAGLPDPDDHRRPAVGLGIAGAGPDDQSM